MTGAAVVLFSALRNAEAGIAARTTVGDESSRTPARTTRSATKESSPSLPAVRTFGAGLVPRRWIRFSRTSLAQNVADLESLTNQGQPQNLYSVHYTGVVTSQFFVEAQYSARRLALHRYAERRRRIRSRARSFSICLNAIRLLEPDFLRRFDLRWRRTAQQQRLRRQGFVFSRRQRRRASHHMVFGYDHFNDNIKANTHAVRQRFPHPRSRSVVPRRCRVSQSSLPNAATSTILTTTRFPSSAKGRTCATIRCSSTTTGG